MDHYDLDYRSGDFRSYGGFGGGGGGGGAGGASGGRGLEIVSAGGSRVHNSGYAVTAPPQPPRSSSSSTSWWDDPDVKRRRRVASYKAYSVEGRVKASLRKGFRWIKTKCSELVHGW